MDEGLHKKLTLVSAPAGFGKTTLVSEWVAAQRGKMGTLSVDSHAALNNIYPKSEQASHVAWLSLDEGDNNPTRFLTYLVTALQGITPAVGHNILDLLLSPQPPPTESLLTALLNEAASSLSPPSAGSPQKFVVVLDDYHLIHSKAVNDILLFLLEYLPAQIHLILTTREDPPLPLARYRVKGHLTELRAADLRFTENEAGAFLNETMALNLEVEDVSTLEISTEGWIAGLQMAALSMQKKMDAKAFIQTFRGSHQYVMDYLVEEILHHQPEKVRDFLLRTSVLKRFSSPLCNMTTGRTDSDEMIEMVVRGNLFVTPLDDERCWYRYHHLFADALNERLLKEQPEQLPLLHQRASVWHEQSDLLPDAIHHALAAEDFERAAGLIEVAWSASRISNEEATWLGWAQMLPEDTVHARPVLTAAYAWMLLISGDLEAGAKRLQDAEQWLQRLHNGKEGVTVTDEEEFNLLPATIATAHAFYAQASGNGPAVMKHAQHALDRLPNDRYNERAIASAILGLAYWSIGDLDMAYQLIANGLTDLRKAGNIALSIGGTPVIADIRVAQGRLHDAIRLYEQALQVASATYTASNEMTWQGDPTFPGTADLYLGLSQLHLEQGDRQLATIYLTKSEKIGEQAVQDTYPYRLSIAQARFKQVDGDLEAALGLLNEAKHLYAESVIPDVRPVSALMARLWVQQGRLNEAMRWVHARGLAFDDELAYLSEFEYLVLARILLTQYTTFQDKRSLMQASALLDRLHDAAEFGERIGSQIEVFLLQALIRRTQGDIHAALLPLQKGLPLAKQEGYVQILVDEGDAMAQLLHEAVAHGIMPSFVSFLLTHFEPLQPDGERLLRQEKEAHSQSTSSTSIGKSLVEQLTRREREVIQLMSAGLSNPEIATELIISVTTVKTHVKNLYGKLAVNNRVQAVARARELELI
ncbi:MAG: LuxR C-terminal-related transcriptional regulator [Chloroflexota bacterium]